MAKLETNIITPKRNTGKNADIIEDLEIMAQSIQDEFNKKADNSITEDFDKKLGNKVDKEEGKDLSTNDFTNLLKEKLENLENYNDTEIRNLLNGSLKGVNYTASNGMLTFTKNDGSTISVDLPLELLIESGRYDEANKQIVLVLANGNSINIPVSSLLDDFYGKSETYNKTEVDTIIAQKQALIDKLEAENKSQQEEIDMLTADYKEKTVEGETVVIGDGIGKIKADVNGNSYQETTEGYQLLNVQNLLSPAIDVGTTVDNNDYITGGSADSRAYTYANSNWHETLKAGTYSIVVETIKVATNQYIGMQIYDNNNTNLLNVYRVELDNNVTIKSFTLTEETPIGIVFKVFDGIYRVMMLEGTYTTSNFPKYEPYTNGVATPNTGFPQDIEVIDGVNILNPANANSSSILTNTLIEKTRYRLISTTSSNALIFKNLGFKKGTYTVSIQIVSGDYQGGPLVARNSENVNAGEVAIKGTANKMSFVVKDNDINALILWQVPAGTDIVYDIQIEPGEKSSAFLPYGHIGLVQRGANIYNTSLEYGSLSNGVNIDSSESVRSKDFIKVKPNANCAFSVNGELNRVIISLYDKDKKFISTDGTNGLVSENGLFTTYANAQYLKFRSYNADKTLFETGEIQLEYNTKATDYEPYIEPIVHSIDLAGNELAKVGEIADLLKIGVDGSVSIEKKLEEYIFTGYESFVQSGYATNERMCAYYNTLRSDKAPNKIMCNMLKIDNYTQNSNDECITSTANSFTLAIFNSRLTSNSVEGLKNFLKELYDSGTPLKVLYALTEQYYETIDLPSISPIKLFEGTNIFELVTNLGTTLAVTYKVSNKSRLDKLELALLSNGGNV